MRKYGKVKSFEIRTWINVDLLKYVLINFWVEKGYFVSTIVLTYCVKNYFNDHEKLLKFESEGREFAKKIDH